MDGITNLDKYLSNLYQMAVKLDDYAYQIEVIDIDDERSFTTPTSSAIKKGILKIIDLYLEIKDINISPIIDGLLLEDIKIREQFYFQIESSLESIKKQMEKISELHYMGVVYNNKYTRSLNNRALMREALFFVKYNSLYTIFNRAQLVSSKSSGNNLQKGNNIAEIHIPIKNTKQEIAIELLQEIWLPQAKISIEELIATGIQNKIWNKDLILIARKNSLYGSQKILIASLSVALLRWAINDTIDFKIIGEKFCTAFDINNKPNTKNPYKSFQSGNPKYIKEFKRLLKIPKIL